MIAGSIVLLLIVLIALGIGEWKGANGTMGILRVIYVLAIAGFLVGTMAAGIAAFYEEPDYPVHDPPKGYPRESPEYKAWQAEWEVRLETHEADLRDHHRNVFFIAYPIGLVLVVLGMELKPRLDVLKPGFTLGGMGILIYALAQDDLSNKIRFIGVALALVVLIYVGYRIFVQRKAGSQEA